MSELLDKKVNAQKENLKKYFRGSHELPQAHEKVCDENERKKQTNKEKRRARKNVINGREHIIGRLQKQVKTIGRSFRTTILDTMKVPFV